MATDDNSMNEAQTMRAGGAGTLGRIDQYDLLKELGGGGFGTVYLARDTVSGIDVAVKGLPPLVKNSREEVENIRSNFALVSRLHHPNIAAALVLHPAKDVVYASEDIRQKLRVNSGDMLMVMEYAPGVTLSQWRRQFPEKKVPIGQALEITRQIASALDYAHERKIVHRDIKPANVMIETSEDGSVTARVLDFGLAAEIRSSMGRVSREIHDTSGTRPYMAPEQWLGGKQGPATDQYALAALFCELVTGEVPFAAVFDTGDSVVMMNVAGREPFTPPQDLPKPVRLALATALAKKPEERFLSCDDFVAALEGRPSRERSRLSRPSGGSRSRVAATTLLGAAALLAALVGGGYFGWTKYGEGVKAREAEEARVAREKVAEASRIKQEVYELKGKASQAREKNANEEWQEWPHFSLKAKELEGAFRAGESAFEKDDYAAARELFLKVRDNWRWLSSNKVERACAVAAKDQAEEGWRKADAAEAGKLAADAYLEASNVLSRAAQAFDSGDFGAANAGFKKADSLFAHAASRASDVRIAAGRAKMEAERKKAESELDREEAETAARISTLRKEMNDALSVQDDVTALAKADLLVELSLDARDAKEWVDIYLRLADKESNLFARLQMTESIRDILDKGHAWRVDVETMRRTDLADPAVLNMFGKFLSTDSHGFKRNPALAREFFSRSLAGGFKDAAEGFNQRDEEIRQKPYFDAASSGNIAKVRRVFTKEHPHADIVDRNGRTPMFAAAQNGDAEILDYMDSLGFKWDAQDKKGEVPFFSACASTNAAKALSAVKWFVEKKGFDCNWRNSSTNRYATMNGLFNVKRLDVFEYLISKGAKPDVRDNQGRTILHRYISGGCDLALVEAAIKAGVDVESEDDGGEQPIHCAAHGDGDEADKVVLLLLRRGVDVNARVRKGKKETYRESYTPLHVACAAWHADAKIGNRIKAIRALLANGADLEAVTSAGVFNGRTPLLMAADRCDAQVLEVLLDAGADVNARVSEGIFQGRMAIHIAASAAENTNCVRTLQILLSHGANLRSKVVGSAYDEGQSPVHCAIGRIYSGLDPGKAKPFYAAMRFMLESGGDVNQEAKKERFRITTPLGVACERADAGIVSFLLEHGAKKSLGLASTDGWSLLHIVANRRRDRDKRECDAHERIIGLLVKAGMDVDGRIGGGVYKDYTALHIAAQAKNVHAIRALIAHGADVNARSARLETPLMILAEQTKEENLEACISYLLMSGADANIPDKNGKTPRERAKTSVARYLLSMPWKKNASAVNANTKAALEAFRRSSCDGKAALSAGYRLAQNADENDPNIQLYLAGCYAEGLPLPTNEGRTLSWYRDRARNGDANAQFLYGTLLANGKGVSRDEKAASQLLEQSAKNGNAAAQAMYGILLCEKEHNYQEGMRWLRKSADSGVDLAEAMTARYLLQGQNGIEKDVAEARRLGLKLLAKGFWPAPQR